MKRVLIVEDHAGFREALARLFEWNTEIEDDLQASTLDEGRRRIGHLDGVEMAVVDLGLPDGEGSDLIRDLRASDPDMTIVVLTNTHDPERHARALEAGADGVLTKDAAADEILNTARRVGGI
jgi:DNA-binding NarL/FixJ family response regulator